MRSSARELDIQSRNESQPHGHYHAMRSRQQVQSSFLSSKYLAKSIRASGNSRDNRSFRAALCLCTWENRHLVWYSSYTRVAVHQAYLYAGSRARSFLAFTLHCKIIHGKLDTKFSSLRRRFELTFWFRLRYRFTADLNVYALRQWHTRIRSRGEWTVLIINYRTLKVSRLCFILRMAVAKRS